MPLAVLRFNQDDRYVIGKATRRQTRCGYQAFGRIFNAWSEAASKTAVAASCPWVVPPAPSATTNR